jgi:PKD repeat protein
MKKIILIILISCFAAAGFGQNFSYVEYFIDEDPGYGLGTNVPVPAGADLSVDFELPLSTLDDGLHTIFVRARQDDGFWSHTINRSFLKQRLPVDLNPEIVSLEYFFDSDPGFGQATSVELDNLSPMSITANLPLESLNPGLHSLYVRSKDENGRWSIVMQRSFVVSSHPDDPPIMLISAEYFIDTDPGPGNGEPVLFDPNNGSVIQQFEAALEGYETGEHRLYVRSKDENESWSIVYTETFEVEEPPIIAEFSADITAGSVPLVVQFTDETYVSSPTEWLWDFGDGNTSTQQNPEHIFANPGEFTVSLTATGIEGIDTEIKENYITVFPPIYSLEYFFDEDPGYGHGNGVYTYSSNMGGFDFLIPLDDLDEGYHLLFVRVRDTSEVWTQTMSRSFLKTRLLSDPDPSIVQVEYFMDEDPGYGLAEQLAVNNVATPHVDALIPLDEFEDGLHNIYVRSKDVNGRWSETMARPFLKSYVPDDVVNVSGLEYFIDADPGVGNGTAVSIPSPSYALERNFVVNLGAQIPGEHRLFVRAIDNRGSWSIVYNQLIEVTATGAVHVLQLPEGWSGISSYVIPDTPAVETIFEPVVDNMVILQNFDGMFWPYAGVNTIGNWNDMDGYQVKMETARQVTFTGSMQNDLSVNLNSGWNYLPVLNACDNLSEDFFSEISGSLQIVKEIAGPEVYWPQFGINTLEQIKPGKAYFVLVDEDVEVGFPECDQDMTPTPTMTPIPAFPLEGEGGEPTNKSHKTKSDPNGGMWVGTPSPVGEGWGEVSQCGGTPLLLEEKGLGDEVSLCASTPVSHTIAIPLEAISGLNPGDYIKVCGSNGQCYGAVVYQSRNLALTAFGDDPTSTHIDGFTEGEIMQFRVFNPETSMEYPLDVEFETQMPQGGYFVNHGLSAIKSIETSGISSAAEMSSSVRVFPNPSTGIFTIRISDLTGFENLLGLTIDWEISDIHGSIIATGSNEGNDFSINLTSHPKGIYYLKISQGGMQTVKKLVVQ